MPLSPQSTVQHYENFPVASILLPGHLRHAVGVIYAFARAADDFADEGEISDDERLALLDGFRRQLDRIATQNVPETPLFSDVAEIVAQFHLPLQPFYDLLDAFSQDVTKKRYANFAELMDYCRRSANPVGELLLHLYGAATPKNLAYSNAICSSLQLINFLQDITIDLREKNRIYLPQDEMQRYGIRESALASGMMFGRWNEFMQFEIERARKLLHSGTPLCKTLPGRIALELRMIVLGGETILRKLHKNSDVFNERPVLEWRDWVFMGWRALFWKQKPAKK
ncbi:MAG: squalene synthase HpnC [Sulfuricella sp.]|nr:squalene synthase HpnC [Sulfuricella sp.]